MKSYSTTDRPHRLSGVRFLIKVCPECGRIDSEIDLNWHLRGCSKPGDEEWVALLVSPRQEKDFRWQEGLVDKPVDEAP